MRQGWRWAGLKAELEHLVAARFTGEARYWPDGAELRRELKEVLKAENGQPKDGKERMEIFLPRIEQWSNRPEGRLTVFYQDGAIRRVEL